MAGCCQDDACAAARPENLNSPEWRLALWIALAVNAAMFAAEIVAGAVAGSSSLRRTPSTSSATHRITPSASASPEWALPGARAAQAKASFLVALGLWVLASTGWPDVIVAAIMGTLALSGGWQILRQAKRELRTVAQTA